MKSTVMTLTVVLMFVPEGADSRQSALSRPDALAVLRALNSVQADARREHNGYLNLTAVLSSEAFQAPQLSTVMNTLKVEPQNASLAGAYSLRMVVDDSKRSYSVALVGKDRCAPSWFSDTHGVVYEGRAVGCGQ